MYERIGGTDALDARTAFVSHLGGEHLVRDGDVQTFPRPRAQKVLGFLWLAFHKRIGDRSELCVDLRRPAVAELSAEQSESQLLLICH